ncbi:MAG: AarF/ABC1/UbiB kinase family protein [Roseinatronobacter sp.]|nr:MAG: AarF/ABC1/UbiB kinase family protein [Roseinatronobacter sp.]
MSHDPPPSPRSVPQRAFARNLRIGGVAGGILGATLGGVASNLMRGRRVDLAQAALTPANALRLAGGLGHLRGAAMKLGQMLSMENGFALPSEITAILGQLQANAPAMPPKQLKAVLISEWGADWHKQFARFDVHPLAAASIGQVHRARLRDGTDLAIKVQFPGVAESIDSDIATLGRLMRMPGVLPKGMQIAPLLTEASAQLHQEADYRREAAALAAYGAAMQNDPAFIVPQYHKDFSTPRILAMDYVESAPIEALADAAQDIRNIKVAQLITLVLREIFDLGYMQTDPNFANYRLAPDGRLVLLDFGATRDIASDIAAQYRGLLRAFLAKDRVAIWEQMLALGYFAPDQPEARQALIVDLAVQASAPLRQASPYDFGRATLIEDLAVAGAELGAAKDFWHVPPADLLFMHRKIGGMFLLAQRLRATVDLRAVLAPWA